MLRNSQKNMLKDDHFDTHKAEKLAIKRVAAFSGKFIDYNNSTKYSP